MRFIPPPFQSKSLGLDLIPWNLPVSMGGRKGVSSILLLGKCMEDFSYVVHSKYWALHLPLESVVLWEMAGDACCGVFPVFPQDLVSIVPW